MKVKYYCEVCGKEYATEEEVRKCESAHSKKKALEKEKEEDHRAIIDLEIKFAKKYHELPSTEFTVEDLDQFTEEELEALAKHALHDVGDVFEKIITTLKEV